MRIGVVSDTHLREGRVKLPARLTEILSGVDYILHLGDWTSLEVYRQLSALAPVDGIAGNNDGYEIIERFGEKKILTFEGIRIGLVHGHEPYSSRLTTPQKARKAFEGDSVQVILFGHSHQPYLQSDGGVLMFNPGSPTDKRREKQYSFGILEIDKGNLSASHIYYDHNGRLGGE
ncbi:metallophosphoesterase family protein [Paenibacillus pinistramenti]|uniref:metallophosphoesterase family protein n=1 Tax=Paenibacillus pinistramenti TaxID=1768003 RepID=UPI0011086EB9|nr:metallophosphoesterase [Paenibacillus pinistramenti]